MDKDKEIKRLKEEIERLKKLVVEDELTGVLNRKGINEDLDAIFNEAKALASKKHKRRFHIDNFSMVFIDADNFKKINDTYGHDAGDDVLKKIARFLKKKTRSIDVVGRLGGEEFVIAMLGATEDEAYEKADDIRKGIKAELRVGKHKDLEVTVSVGVASVDKAKPKNVEELIAYADKAMYEAKHNRGKDNVVKYSEIS
ncbi:MAG: GGDEF domain-containing protein [Parcubacteria group bacterium]|nr:GGDEF domain-containing protein [Parcubacteria group bacterium]MCR4342283.1 GGDEF domain-containing protein [Patescibacteria group bacterium]